MRRARRRKEDHNGEFLWLVSLSDLMILLFVFFVVIFSFTFKKMGQADFQRMAAVLKDQKQAATPLDDIQKRLLKWVVDRRLMDAVTVEPKEDSLILHIKEKVLFESGNFALSSEGVELIQTIGRALEKIPAPYRIGIEGHTDDAPIHIAGIADNWELSAKRAHAVLRSLELGDEAMKRSVILGYAEMQPIAANRTEDGEPIPANQQKNRRVTIRIF